MNFKSSKENSNSFIVCFLDDTDYDIIIEQKIKRWEL